MAPRKATIIQLRKLVQMASRENPHLTTRLEKAAFLVSLRHLVTMGDDHYRVGAEDGLRNYEVLNGHCECADYLRHGAGHHCKHRLVLSLSQELGFTQAPPTNQACTCQSRPFSTLRRPFHRESIQSGQRGFATRNPRVAPRIRPQLKFLSNEFLRPC